MIRSMTGFGEAERDTPAGLLRVEIRTVNHRFLHLQLRTPPGMDRLETEIAAWLRPFLSRGHAKVTVTLERPVAGPGAALPLDLERAGRIRDALRRLSSDLGVPGEVDLALLARFGDIFRAPAEADEPEAEIPVELLRDAMEEALRGVVAMRTGEGARLAADLRERLGSMADALDRVSERAPERLIQERDRLREAIRALSDGVAVDEDRLAREVAHLAERWDINEELVRFRAHLEAFLEALDHPVEPMGKRLGFLVQELHREANTIGSKANDLRISQASMVLKEEIERVREQLENVE